MKKIKISKLKPNPNNPRTISKEKFDKLVTSIKEFPKMLELRPLIVDENFVVLGGNMRLKALEQLGIKEVPYIQESELTDEQKKQFIIKDNLSFGNWDWDILGNEWDNVALNDWGMDIWRADEIDYSPELNPIIDTSDVTQDEIEKKALELAKQMTSESKKQEAICPKCFYEFNIQI
tara:strand:- start:917 stop:1447 length:531 start_codon:yes stop_codon:yes gene_type:complete